MIDCPLPLLDLQFIHSELAVGKHGLIDLLVGLQLKVFSQKLEDLLDDIAYFIFDLVKYPVIVAFVAQYSRVFQVYEVSRRLGLRKIQYFFHVSDAHFAVHKNEVENAEPGFVCTGFKNLGSQGKIKTF